MQAEVEASSVDLGQAFINEYASFRVGLVVRAQPKSLAEYSVSGLPGAEPHNDGRLRVFILGRRQSVGDTDLFRIQLFHYHAKAISACI